MFLDTAQHLIRYLRIEACFSFSLTIKMVMSSLKIGTVFF